MASTSVSIAESAAPATSQAASGVVARTVLTDRQIGAVFPGSLTTRPAEKAAVLTPPPATLPPPPARCPSADAVDTENQQGGHIDEGALVARLMTGQLAPSAGSGEAEEAIADRQHGTTAVASLGGGSYMTLFGGFRYQMRRPVESWKYAEMRRTDGSVSYICRVCHSGYKHKKSLNKHWKDKHSDIKCPDGMNPGDADDDDDADGDGDGDGDSTPDCSGLTRGESSGEQDSENATPLLSTAPSSGDPRVPGAGSVGLDNKENHAPFGLRHGGGGGGGGVVDTEQVARTTSGTPPNMHARRLSVPLGRSPLSRLHTGTRHSLMPPTNTNTTSIGAPTSLRQISRPLPAAGIRPDGLSIPGGGTSSSKRPPSPQELLPSHLGDVSAAQPLPRQQASLAKRRASMHPTMSELTPHAPLLPPHPPPPTSPPESMHQHGQPVPQALGDTSGTLDLSTTMNTFLSSPITLAALQSITKPEMPLTSPTRQYTPLDLTTVGKPALMSTTSASATSTAAANKLGSSVNPQLLKVLLQTALNTLDSEMANPSAEWTPGKPGGLCLSPTTLSLLHAIGTIFVTLTDPVAQATDASRPTTFATVAAAAAAAANAAPLGTAPVAPPVNSLDKTGGVCSGGGLPERFANILASGIFPATPPVPTSIFPVNLSSFPTSTVAGGLPLNQLDPTNLLSLYKQVGDQSEVTPPPPATSVGFSGHPNTLFTVPSPATDSRSPAPLLPSTVADQTTSNVFHTTTCRPDFDRSPARQPAGHKPQRHNAFPAVRAPITTTAGLVSAPTMTSSMSPCSGRHSLTGGHHPLDQTRSPAAGRHSLGGGGGGGSKIKAGAAAVVESGRQGDQTDGVILCPVCQFDARWFSELRAHMVNHSEHRMFGCCYCVYRAKWKWDVAKHMRRCPRARHVAHLQNEMLLRMVKYHPPPQGDILHAYFPQDGFPGVDIDRPISPPPSTPSGTSSAGPRNGLSLALPAEVKPTIQTTYSSPHTPTSSEASHQHFGTTALGDDERLASLDTYPVSLPASQPTLLTTKHTKVEQEQQLVPPQLSRQVSSTSDEAPLNIVDDGDSNEAGDLCLDDRMVEPAAGIPGVVGASSSDNSDAARTEHGNV